MPQEWRRPVVVNDWGHETVHLVDPDHRPRRDPYTDAREREREPSLTRAGRYWVRWPDGTEEEVEVEMRPYSVTIGDMGHDYHTGGHRPYIVMFHHGARVSALLTDANVLVRLDTSEAP